MPINLKINKGFIFGLLLLGSTIDLTIGLFLLLLYFCAFHVNSVPRGRYSVILYLLLLKAVWIISVNIFFSNKSINSAFVVLVPDVIILAALFVRVNYKFLKNVLNLLLLLFFIDILFNLSTLILGFDLIGRTPGVRPEDLVPRLGGVMGHPFYSVNISLSGLIAGLYFSNKKIVFASLIALAVNGTFRSPLMFFLVSFVWFLHFKSYRPLIKYVGYTLFIALVVFVTIMSSAVSEVESGNLLRFIAWNNALINIVSNPLFGSHSFTTGSFEVMSIDTIIDYGIAESMPLQLALDYGLLPAIISIIVLVLVVNQTHASYAKSSIEDARTLTASVLASVMFVDFFYGTAYGSVLITFVFSLICISLEGVRPSNKTVKPIKFAST